MKKIIKGISFVVATSISFSAMAADTVAQPAPQVANQPKVNIKRGPEEKIGSWFHQCETIQVDGVDKETVCALVQNFAVLGGADKKQEIPVMRLQIHKVLPKDKKEKVAFLGVRTPLGIDLATGMKLQISGKDYKSVPFTTCYAEPLGCRASYIIEGDLLTALNSGKNIQFLYKSLEGQAISSEAKTDGFVNALAKLQ
jgi:invasion protein IalB